MAKERSSDALDGRGARAPRDEAVGPTIGSWIAGARMPREALFLVGFVAPALTMCANMWRVRAFTVDDAYISYRYARNFARGLGLVYNPGERIEGYTNFSWTVLLGLAMKLGLDPDSVAKVLGASSALGALWLTYLIAARLRPFDNFPCVATWLLASTAVFTGYAVYGLETAGFAFLVLLGLWLFFREEEAFGAERGGRVPWSGLAFGLAGLTRPEAPLFLGVPMLLLGLGFFSRRNLLRGAVFVAVVGAHVLWRHAYYGSWVPNTLGAKTGNLTGQLHAGWDYLQGYFSHAGALVWLAPFGAAVALFERRRAGVAIAALALLVSGYVVVVGGDWMPFFRFMAPFEPLCFLLVDLGARTALARRDRPLRLGLALFGLAMVFHRVDAAREAQRTILAKEDRFWKMAAGGTARWLLDHGDPGEIAIGDIGYVGYATDYPVLDLLGLVDPVISKLPGGYTRKLGPGFNDRFFDEAPKYFLLISANVDCNKPSVPGSQVLYADRRFKGRYEVAGHVPLDAGFAWCIYRRRADAAPEPPAPSPSRPGSAVD